MSKQPSQREATKKMLLATVESSNQRRDATKSRGIENCDKRHELFTWFLTQKCIIVDQNFSEVHDTPEMRPCVLSNDSRRWSSQLPTAAHFHCEKIPSILFLRGKDQQKRSLQFDRVLELVFFLGTEVYSTRTREEGCKQCAR